MKSIEVVPRDVIFAIASHPSLGRLNVAALTYSVMATVLISSLSDQISSISIVDACLGYIKDTFPFSLARYADLEAFRPGQGNVYLLTLISSVLVWPLYLVLFLILKPRAQRLEGNGERIRGVHIFRALAGTAFIIFTLHIFFVGEIEISTSKYIGNKIFLQGWTFVLLANGLAWLASGGAYILVLTIAYNLCGGGVRK